MVHGPESCAVVFLNVSGIVLQLGQDPLTYQRTSSCIDLCSSRLTTTTHPWPLSLQVSFPIKGDPGGASLVAWTTTPWTLPSNLALCVNPGFTYVRVRNPTTGAIYIVAEARLASLPGAVPKPKKAAGGKGKDGKKGKEGAAEGEGAGAAAAAADGGFEVLQKFLGTELVRGVGV